MWRAGPIGADFRHEEVQTRFIEKAQAYLKARAEAADHRPFFLYLALAAPHTPIVPTAAFGGRTRTNPYGDFVAQVDAGVGELLVTLDRYGLATNTMVVFTADNGCSPAADLDELRRLRHDPSAGFRGHKADLFEGGHRVPFVVRWPGQVPAGTHCSQPIGQVDLLATCAEILNLTLPDSAGEDSVSFLELLRGGEAPPPRREIPVRSRGNRPGSGRTNASCPDDDA
jgi:arylsulfatase A-like enzyme